MHLDDYVFTLSWRMPQWKQNLCFVLEKSLRRKTLSCLGRIHYERWRVCFFCKRLQSELHYHPNVSFLFTSWRRVRLQQQMLEGFTLNAQNKMTPNDWMTKAAALQRHRVFISMWPWSTDAVISSTAMFVAITNNTLYGSKFIFLLWQKSLVY